MRVFDGIIACLFLFISTGKLSAQTTQVEQVTVFSSRLKNPVSMEVKADTAGYQVFARNKSLFPYYLEITFEDFRNLSPRVFNKTVLLMPGLNKLFSFKIVDKYEAPSLSYHIKYYLASTTSSAERFSPYLIPVGKNKTVNYVQDTGETPVKLYIDQFVMNAGDTVFCARKGIVTALPDNAEEVDRLMEGTLEIRHDDGTIAVYFGLDPGSAMVKLGQKVYPGQPAGKAGIAKMLMFKVFEIQEEGRIKPIDILYCGPGNQLLTPLEARGQKVCYPEETIRKEMTRNEISRYRKNTLYEK